MAQVASKTCEICVSSPGHNYCKECEQLFCDGCKISHLRTKMTKNHSFVKEGSELKWEIVANRSTQTPDDETEKEIQMKLNELQFKIQKIDKGKMKYQSDVNRVIQTIKAEGSQLKKLIDETVKGFISAVKERDSINLQTIQSIGNELRNALHEVQAHKKSHQETLKITDTTQLFPRLDEIKSQIRAIEEKQIPEMPSIGYTKHNAPMGQIAELFGYLSFGYTN